MGRTNDREEVVVRPSILFRPSSALDYLRGGELEPAVVGGLFAWYVTFVFFIPSVLLETGFDADPWPLWLSTLDWGLYLMAVLFCASRYEEGATENGFLASFAVLSCPVELILVIINFVLYIIVAVVGAELAAALLGPPDESTQWWFSFKAPFNLVDILTVVAIGGLRIFWLGSLVGKLSVTERKVAESTTQVTS